jgi:hypothetical protein
MSGQIENDGGCHLCGIPPSPRCNENKEYIQLSYDFGCNFLGCQYKCQHISYLETSSNCCLGNSKIYSPNIYNNEYTCNPKYIPNSIECTINVYNYACNSWELFKTNMYCNKWLLNDPNGLNTYENILQNHCTKLNLNSTECNDCFILESNPCGKEIINYCNNLILENIAVLTDPICSKFCNKQNNIYKEQCDIIFKESCKNIYPQVGFSGENCDCFYDINTNYGLVNLKNNSIHENIWQYGVLCVLPSCRGLGYKTNIMLNSIKNCPDCIQTNIISHNNGNLENLDLINDCHIINNISFNNGSVQVSKIQKNRTIVSYNITTYNSITNDNSIELLFFILILLLLCVLNVCCIFFICKKKNKVLPS